MTAFAMCGRKHKNGFIQTCTLLRCWFDLAAQKTCIPFTIHSTDNRTHWTNLGPGSPIGLVGSPIHDAVNPHQQLPLANASILMQLRMVILLFISCKFVCWPTRECRNELHLSTTHSMAFHCPLSCERNIAEQTPVFLAGQQETIPEYV